MKIFSKLLQEPWLLLFGLFQLSLTALGVLHVRRSFSPFFSSPKLLLLLVLLALYVLFATATAIFETVRHRSVKQQQKQRLPQTHRLRPLLFVTSTVSVFGVPTLFVLPYFCRHFSPHILPLDFDGICAAFGAYESASLFSIVLSLLITASIPLRALLHRQLAELRQDALWTRFIGRNCWICAEID
uniref:G_PROTEIN_RECEP_F1_2 domain-containing protein n=1 Tax=Globodera pallida TaxID=36090 RepID=A0A183CDT2_GLOPA